MTPPPAPTRSSHREIEVKLRIADRRALLQSLTRLHARLDESRVHERNALYDTPDGALFHGGQVLRIRVTRRAPTRGAGKARARAADCAAWLTYKGPAAGSPRKRGGKRYKVREEREIRIPDAEAVAAILEALGFRPSFRYEKYRTTYRLPRAPGAKIEFDETPVGDFVEIEGDRASIDRAAKSLGFGPADYITTSYGGLFDEFLRARRGAGARKRSRGAGRDMLFRKLFPKRARLR